MTYIPNILDSHDLIKQLEELKSELEGITDELDDTSTSMAEARQVSDHDAYEASYVDYQRATNALRAFDHDTPDDWDIHRFDPHQMGLPL